MAGALLGTIAAFALTPFLPLSSDIHHQPAHPAEKLLDEHCWTGTDDRTAVAAVVTLPNGRTVRSRQHLDPALEHVIEGKHPRLRVHGFCAR